MKPRSKKKAAEYRERMKMLEEKYPGWKEGLHECERCLMAVATDPHELKMRSAGGSITDPENVRLICNRCHTEIHANPQKSYEDGWLIKSFDSVRPPVQERSILKSPALILVKPPNALY